MHAAMEEAWERQQAAQADPEFARQVYEMERAKYRTSITDRHDAIGIPAIHSEAIRSGKDEHGNVIAEIAPEGELRKAIDAGKRIVYLVGVLGTGKTLSACRWACSQNRHTLYAKAIRYCNLVKTRSPHERFMNCDVLILDEIGMERELDADIIAELIHERYEQGRTTIGISNMDADKVADHYGDPIARRTWAAGAIVKCEQVVCPGQQAREAHRDQ